MNRVKAHSPEGDLSTRAHPHLGVLLERTRRALNAEMLARFRAAGFGDLREGHGPVFAFMPSDGARLTQLAERARMTKQSMGELVSELESMGYVRRDPDPNDGRAKVVRLTARGRRASTIGVRAVADTERAWGTLLGHHRVAELRRTLEEISVAGRESTASM